MYGICIYYKNIFTPPPPLYKIGLNSRAVFDNLGRAVNEFMGDNYTNFLSLNVLQFNSGVYHYFIEYENTGTASKKLVIR